MLIGIDASRASVARRTGTEGYSLQIIREMLRQGEGQHRFILYFRDQPAPDLFPEYSSVTIRVIRQPRMWTHRGLGPAVIRDRPDVLFVPAHVIPWPGVGGVPAVVTVHDLGYLHYPDKHPLPDRLYLDWSTRYSARNARRVIAVSQVTRHDLVHLNNTPPSQVSVIYSGVDDLLEPVADAQRLAEIRQRIGVDGRYILHVGSIQPRKNLLRLVQAFDMIRDEFPDVSLVLAGQMGWGYRRLLREIRQDGLSRRVIMPGYVPDSNLAALYTGAAV